MDKKPERKNKSSRKYNTNHPRYAEKNKHYSLCTCTVCGHEWPSKLLVPKCGNCGTRRQENIKTKVMK